MHKAIKLPPTIVNLIAILKTKFGIANIQSSNLCIAPEQNMITNFGLNKTTWHNGMDHSVKVKASVALCATTVLASEDPRDLQPPAEGLVEEQPCLELRDEGEPRQHGNGQEDEEPHGVLVHPRHLLDGVPWSHLPKRSTGPLPELGTARTSA